MGAPGSIDKREKRTSVYEQLDLFGRSADLLRVDRLDSVKRAFITSGLPEWRHFDDLRGAYAAAGKIEESMLISGLRDAVFTGHREPQRLMLLSEVEKFFTVERTGGAHSPAAIKDVMDVAVLWMSYESRVLTSSNAAGDMLAGSVMAASSLALGEEVDRWYSKKAGAEPGGRKHT